VKLLFENWRRYIKEEEVEDKFNFGSIVVAELLSLDNRHVVVVKTLDGPVAFYRSTGSGTGKWTKDKYIPFDGVTPDGPAKASHYWYAKMDPKHPQSGDRSSKVPKEGSEFDRIGEYLSEKYGQTGTGPSVHEFMKLNGYKSTEDLGIKPHPVWGNSVYDSIAINTFLKKYGALGALGNRYSWFGIDSIEDKNFPTGKFPMAEKR